ASLLHADGHIYFFSEEGVTTVIEPDTEFQKIGVNKLDGSIYATPAVADRAVFIRTDQALYRIENLGTQNPQPREDPEQ
ncbi:MAG: hypothetical protein N2C12_07610, partial [Planctomycetales bacterium]